MAAFPDASCTPFGVSRQLFRQLSARALWSVAVWTTFPSPVGVTLLVRQELQQIVSEVLVLVAVVLGGLRHRGGDRARVLGDTPDLVLQRLAEAVERVGEAGLLADPAEAVVGDRADLVQLLGAQCGELVGDGAGALP